MMGDSVEDLLAQIKAQYAEAEPSDASVSSSQAAPVSQPQQPVSSQPASPPQSSSSPAPRQASSGSINDLLADIEGKPTSSRQSERSQSPIIPPLSSSSQPPILPLDEEHSRLANPSQNKPKDKISTDRLLDDLKTQYEERDRTEELKRQEQFRAEELKRQAQLQEEQRRQAELKRQKQKAALQQAEEWLKRLDPRSGEAAWFEEFAAKYDSKLEAAIDYLGLEQ